MNDELGHHYQPPDDDDKKHMEGYTFSSSDINSHLWENKGINPNAPGGQRTMEKYTSMMPTLSKAEEGNKE